MGELPELLAEAVGDATVCDAIDIGGGDVVAVTPQATYVYRSDGLLRDESVDVFDHDIEQLSVDPGRRKHEIRFVGFGDEDRLTVPAKVATRALEAILEGILQSAGIVGSEETVTAQFRFSELTVVVTDEQLLKHVGSAVWNDEYETFHYADLTGLDFEEGNVNTQIIVRTDDSHERVKISNDRAGRVRSAIQRAVFEYHDVSSLAGLRAAIAPEAETDDGAESEPESESEPGPDEELERDPQRDTDTGSEPTARTSDEDGFVAADWSPSANRDATGPNGEGTAAGPSSPIAESTNTRAGEEARASGAELAGRIEAITEQLEYQTELLERQQATIEQLVDELRRGR